MLEIRNLSKSFGKKQVLHDVSLTMVPGIYGLLGPNGAGKTTLMRTIAGIYKIQSGEVLFDGIPIANNKDFTRNIGYLPQKFGLFKDMTAYEMLDYLGTMKEISSRDRKDAIMDALELVNLSDRQRSKVKTLSGGMLRRLGIAQAILGSPRLIIFDEPTAGLDPEERTRFKSILAQLPKQSIVLLSTHIVEDVEAVCSRIVLIDQGRIAANGTAQKISDIAAGKVWSVPASGKDDLMEPYFVIRPEGISGELLRVISPAVQNGIAVKPTIEDGYLCRTKGLG